VGASAAPEYVRAAAMSLAQFSDVTFGYPGTEILTGASMLIRPGERMALLGPNGTGKSTALRLLAGDLSADSGDVRVLGRASVAYLRQSQEFAGAGTLMDALLEPFAALQALHDEMTAIEHRLGEASPAEVQRYGELQERYMREGGYDLESRVRRLTADVGFSEADLGRSLQRHGFTRLTHLNYLRRDLDLPLRWLSARSPLAFQLHAEVAWLIISSTSDTR